MKIETVKLPPVDYQITIRTKDNDNSIRILRAALKLLLRKFGLKVIEIKQCPQTSKPTVSCGRF
jgi:hypothetical protein